MSRPDSAQPLSICYTHNVPSPKSPPSISECGTTQCETSCISVWYQIGGSSMVSDTRQSYPFKPLQCQYHGSPHTCTCCTCTPYSHLNYSRWHTDHPPWNYTRIGPTPLMFPAAQSHSNARIGPGSAAPHSIPHAPYPPPIRILDNDLPPGNFVDTSRIRKVPSSHLGIFPAPPPHDQYKQWDCSPEWSTRRSGRFEGGGAPAAGRLYGSTTMAPSIIES